MTVRLNGNDLVEAIIEYVSNRGMHVKGKINVQHWDSELGWLDGAFEAIFVDVPVEAPPNRGPYR